MVIREVAKVSQATLDGAQVTKIKPPRNPLWLAKSENSSEMPTRRHSSQNLSVFPSKHDKESDKKLIAIFNVGNICDG